MLTKFGLGAAMLSCYSACFSDDKIFPPHKRATAIGMCNIVARFFTIFAPEINELVAPLPMLIFILIISVALVSSFTFFTIEADDEGSFRDIEDMEIYSVFKQKEKYLQTLSTEAGTVRKVSLANVKDFRNLDQFDNNDLSYSKMSSHEQSMRVQRQNLIKKQEDPSLDDSFSKSESLYSLHLSDEEEKGRLGN